MITYYNKDYIVRYLHYWD